MSENVSGFCFLGFFFLFFFGVAFPRIISTIMNGGRPVLPDCYIDHKISRTLNIIYCMILVNFYQIKDNSFHFHLAKRFYHE